MYDFLVTTLANKMFGWQSLLPLNLPQVMALARRGVGCAHWRIFRGKWWVWRSWNGVALLFRLRNILATYSVVWPFWQLTLWCTRDRFVHHQRLRPNCMDDRFAHHLPKKFWPPPKKKNHVWALHQFDDGFMVLRDPCRVAGNRYMSWAIKWCHTHSVLSLIN